LSFAGRQSICFPSTASFRRNFAEIRANCRAAIERSIHQHQHQMIAPKTTGYRFSSHSLTFTVCFLIKTTGCSNIPVISLKNRFLLLVSVKPVVCGWLPPRNVFLTEKTVGETGLRRPGKPVMAESKHWRFVLGPRLARFRPFCEDFGAPVD